MVAPQILDAFPFSFDKHSVITSMSHQVASIRKVDAVPSAEFHAPSCRFYAEVEMIQYLPENPVFAILGTNVPRR